MSQLVPIEPAKGSTQSRKRRGRGMGSGLGKTSGRGHKGWHSRSGSKRLSWYEGGQMPLQRRLPKRGFSNARFRKRVQIVSLKAIMAAELPKVTPSVLKERGIIKYDDRPMKVLGGGEVSRALEVSAHQFSDSAREKIEKSGGTVIVLDKSALA
ncbi:50S ribosomal protein L15 [Candidatus Neomarinimicrobiota bacterium]